MAKAMAAHRAEDALLLVQAQAGIHSDESGRRKVRDQLMDQSEPGD